MIDVEREAKYLPRSTDTLVEGTFYVGIEGEIEYIPQAVLAPASEQRLYGSLFMQIEEQRTGLQEIV